jgi:PhoPQ-activated pathogenicity-related protein
MLFPSCVRQESSAHLLLHGLAAAALATLVPGAVPAQTQQDPFPALDDPSRALREYVEMDDPTYRWEVRRTGEVAGARFTELLLTSQSWRGITWRHQLFVIWPGSMPEDAGHAFLHIDGGRWDERLADLDHALDLPRQAPLFALIAELLATPLAIVRQVPFQPLFDGLTEDRLVSHTFQEFLRTGEADWPLLLPMVKSAVRAMDAVTELARDQEGLELGGFTVSGGSKRGWTTWLTAAVDPRVQAIVPMSIDVLDMEAHLEHQIAVWGEYSEQIRDYIERGIHEELDTERGQALLTMVDPFRYRQHFTMPKLVVIGTNDPYWPLDALNLYWDELPEPRWVAYLPNTGHSADDYPRLIGSLAVLHRNVVEGTPALPELEWEFEEERDALTLTVRSDLRPDRVRAWSARAPTRDFREAEWTSRECEVLEEDAWRCHLPRPQEGYAALFSELVYPGVFVLPLHLSTQGRVIPGYR